LQEDATHHQQRSKEPAAQRAHVICTGSTFSKQSCLFHGVCLQPSTDRQQLTAWLLVTASSRHSTQQNVALLQQHLQRVLQGEYSTIDSRSAAAESAQLNGIDIVWTLADGISGSSGNGPLPAVSMSRRFASRDSSENTATDQPAPAAAFNASALEVEPAVAVLWRTVKEHQYSFGHGKYHTGSASSSRRSIRS
jgi:hypothetical protein